MKEKTRGVQISFRLLIRSPRFQSEEQSDGGRQRFDLIAKFAIRRFNNYSTIEDIYPVRKNKI